MMTGLAITASAFFLCGLPSAAGQTSCVDIQVRQNLFCLDRPNSLGLFPDPLEPNEIDVSFGTSGFALRDCKAKVNGKEISSDSQGCLLLLEKDKTNEVEVKWTQTWDGVCIPVVGCVLGGQRTCSKKVHYKPTCYSCQLNGGQDIYPFNLPPSACSDSSPSPGSAEIDLAQFGLTIEPDSEGDYHDSIRIEGGGIYGRHSVDDPAQDMVVTASGISAETTYSVQVFLQQRYRRNIKADYRDREVAYCGSISFTTPGCTRCSNTVLGISSVDDSNKGCCSASCGTCGGGGCSGRPGGGTRCCTGSIVNADKSCSVDGQAPCVMDEVSCDPDEGDDGCEGDLVCCTETRFCVDPTNSVFLNPDACGDPHMTGFLGQKFDFTGEDNGWYCLIKDQNMQVSMRVTSPLPSLPEITYITGLSVVTTDADGAEHDVVIEVKDPHNLDSSCLPGVSPCLADGSLRVVLDGEEALLAPGTVTLGRDMAVSAANLPGECRSFGFETYWELKKLERAQGRRLSERQSMGEWILGDPTATNMEECTEYIARVELEDGGVFAHQSEHASFQIVTPKATIRLSHGRLHQLAMRDPTDQFDLPDHLTWQMNMAIDNNEVNHDATGILGETFVPTKDVDGEPIMVGIKSIRGQQEDYRIEGALGTTFVQDKHAS